MIRMWITIIIIIIIDKVTFELALDRMRSETVYVLCLCVDIFILLLNVLIR